MSAVGSKPLPSALPTLVVVLENYAVPIEIQKILRAVTNALHAEKPRATLNRCFASLRRENPDIYQKAALWLKKPDVTGHISRSGGYWALQKWRIALEQLHRKEMAHKAFGMDTGGRPARGIPRAVDAAVYAVEAHNNGQAPSLNDAIAVAATLYRARIDEIERALPLAVALSSKDQHDMIHHSTLKRK